MAVQDGGGKICFCQIFNISRKQFCGILFSAIFTDSKLCGSIFSNIPKFSHLQATLLSSSFSRVLSSGLSNIKNANYSNSSYY